MLIRRLWSFSGAAAYIRCIERWIYLLFIFIINGNKTIGARASIHEAYFSSQTGILVYTTTFVLFITEMMNFAPQSSSCHRIMPVFCDSQMLHFQMHLMAQLCNYALKGLGDATVTMGQLPVCLLMWQSNLSSRPIVSAARGYNSKLVFSSPFFHPNKHLLPLNWSGVASLILCFPANHTLSSLSDCFL